ncbi:MAG TPA: lysophospholipid acyltransferase family protein, partial [Acetobacteraceae bacterium]
AGPAPRADTVGCMIEQVFAVCNNCSTGVWRLPWSSQSMSPRATPLIVADPSAAAGAAKRLPLVRRILKAILGPLMRAYFHLSLEDGFNVPPRGPAIVVTNHASLLDVPALMVVDPFPDTSTIVKASLFKIPIVSWMLQQWGAIPVERQGRDSSSVRAMLGVLRSGGVMAIAAEGRRTRSGHLESINPVLARIAASANVPVIPLGIRGSYDALPPGRLLPRPRRITVKVGVPFRFERGTTAEAAAERIRNEIAALLPASMQPLEP